MRLRNTMILLNIMLFTFAAASAMAISIKEEIDIGKEANVQILKKDKLYADQKAQLEMRELGNALVKHVQRKEIPYTFQILDSDKEINAFAVPGGYVYYTSGLWNKLNTDERAGVLAHEIIHVDQRHSLDAMIKHQRRRMWTDLALILTGASSTIQQVAGMVNTLHELQYSRGDERQADEMGFELLEKSNMNPAGLLMAMRKIMRVEQKSGSSPPKIFSSHPPTKERLDYLEKMLKDRNIPVPKDNASAAHVADNNQVGSVSSIKGNTARFSSSKALSKGDVIFLTRLGWDDKLEYQTPVPIARGVVTATGSVYSADFELMGKEQIGSTKTLAVSAPQVPAPQGVLARFSSGVFNPTFPMVTGERYLAWQTIWTDNHYQNAVIGYIVPRDDPNQKPLIVQRGQFAYIPVDQNTYITRFEDPDAARWVAAVGSVGKKDVRVEALPGRNVLKNKVYVIRPALWNLNRQVVAKAKAAVIGNKTTLDVYDFEPGWSINNIYPGFDIYLAQE